MYSIKCRKLNYIVKHLNVTLNNYLYYNTLTSGCKEIFKLKYKQNQISKILNVSSLEYTSPVLLVNKLYSTSKAHYAKVLYYKLPEENVHREDIISDLCSKHEPLSPVAWDTVKTEILNKYGNITTVNFDGLLMKILFMKKNVQLAQSFMNYLEVRKLNANLVTLSTYMSLCSEYENMYEKDISKSYRKLQPMIGAILDTNTAESIVKGLSVTDQWRDSFSIINKLPDVQPTPQMQNCIACAALRNNEVDMAWQMINSLVASEKCPNYKVFECFVEAASNLEFNNAEEGYSLIEKLLTFLKDHDIVIHISVAEKLKHYFESHGKVKWKGLNTKLIKGEGKCAACSKNLGSLDLSSDEFYKLTQALFEKIIRKTDIFLSTTPDELIQFEKFIEKHKPFDIVIDGLNIAYMQRNRDVRFLASQLYKVVEHFVKNDKTVLVLGRKHMLKWPKDIMMDISKKSRTFLAENISQDDPFLLYATIYSGDETCFVSRDMMRNHLCRLQDPDLQHLFKRWQKSHQIYLSYFGKNGEPKFKGPLKYDITVQGSMETGWHIPYDEGKTLKPYEVLNNWLCLQRTS